MNWVTIIWSAASGASLALAVLHLVVWFKNRSARASLAFGITALGIVGVAICELGMMQSRTPAAWGTWLRWMHVPAVPAIAGTIWFVRTYLGTGRLWLGTLVVGVRLVVLAMNFYFEPNLNYREISSLRLIRVLDEDVAILGSGIPNHWMWFGQSVLVLWAVFTLDATWSAWRHGPPERRRRALFIGGGITGFVLIASVPTILTLNGVTPMPIVASLGFQCLFFALGLELSRDVLRASQLSRELRVSEERLRLAASAGHVVLWEWRVNQDEIWTSSEGRTMYGLAADAPPSFHHFMASLHPDDREHVLQLVRRAARERNTFAADYRIVRPDGQVRWIAGSGSAEHDPSTGTTLLRGISLDITDRRRSEDEINLQRTELAHLSRVATLGELSGSLAHELNQPLAIILSNAQAAQRLLAQDPPDLAEVREILNDIVNEDRRAGDVIKRLRALLKRGEPERQPLALREVISEVLALMRSDFVARGVVVSHNLDGDRSIVSGDRIPLQQVFLNLFTNACDAMAGNPAEERRLTVALERAGPMVRVAIRDAGTGLPAEANRIFEPFYTTKPHGLGMGLPICRTIVAAHSGRLWAEANPSGGAVFVVELPLMENAPDSPH